MGLIIIFLPVERRILHVASWAKIQRRELRIAAHTRYGIQLETSGEGSK
jgi:hypothetical protein